MNPVFSIIIPLYNKENYIRATLESVLNQTFSDFEIIIINDGSTDNSLSEAKQTLIDFKNATIISQENKGLSATRNMGMSNAKGSIIALLDADDLWKNDYLQTIFTLYNQFPEVSFYGTDYIERIDINKELEPKKNISQSLKNQTFIVNDFFESNKYQNIICPSSLAFKAKICKTIQFDETINYSEDIDFFLKCFISHQLGYSYTNQVILHTNIPNQMTKFGVVNKKITNLDSYENAAKKSPSLKRFLDTKRYHYASQYKLAGDKTNTKNILKHIDYDNLTLKQKGLLKSPLWIHKGLVRLKKRLLQKNIRVTSY